jgi:hypothetical protein
VIRLAVRVADVQLLSLSAMVTAVAAGMCTFPQGVRMMLRPLAAALRYRPAMVSVTVELLL